MPKQKATITVLVGALAITACGDSGLADAYRQLDTDRDGLISRVEGLNVDGLSEQWATLDVNRDGRLDLAEFAAFEVRAPSGAQQLPVPSPE